jgi:hypothetical protein
MLVWDCGINPPISWANNSENRHSRLRAHRKIRVKHHDQTRPYSTGGFSERLLESLCPNGCLILQVNTNASLHEDRDERKNGAVGLFNDRCCGPIASAMAMPSEKSRTRACFSIPPFTQEKTNVALNQFHGALSPNFSAISWCLSPPLCAGELRS